MAFLVEQDIFKAYYPSIHVSSYSEYDLTPNILLRFLETVADEAVGVAAAYDSKCALTTLGLASSSEVLIVRLTPRAKTHGGRKKSNRKGQPKGLDLLRDDILCNSSLPKHALKMDKLAAALYFDFGTRITEAIDLLSVSSDDRQSISAILNALGGEFSLNKAKVIALFSHEGKRTSERDIALQAWASRVPATLDSMKTRLARVPRIDTAAIPDEVYRVFIS